MKSCVFCDIASGRAPADILHRDEAVVAFADRNPQAPDHVLVIPARHVSSLDDAAPDDRELLGRLLLVCAEVARTRQMHRNGYRVVTNVGADAGQTVHHIHFHVIGGRRMGWPPG